MAGAVTVVLSAVGPAQARDDLQQCLDNAGIRNGQLPTCTNVNGTWVPSWPSDSSMSGGVALGGFVFLFTVALLIGLGVILWKIITARRLATQAGLDPGMATQMALLSDDGLDATYLASSLRQPPPTHVASATGSPTPHERPVSSAAARLTELKSLLDQGLVTPSEYDERRRSIIDTV